MRRNLGFVIVLMWGLIIMIGRPALSTAQSKGPIKLGILNPYTGHSAVHGTDFEKGARLYLKQIGYKVEGRPIEIYTEDTEGKPEVGLVKAKRLVEGKGVHMLTGVVMTNVGYALKPYIDTAKVPLLIAAFAGAEELTHPPVSPYLFRISYCPSQAMATFADWGYRKGGWRKATVFSLDYAAGVETNACFARTFKKLGGTVVQEMYAPFGTTDWSPYIAKIDKTVNVIAGEMIGGECIRFLKQWREYGLQGKITLAFSGFEDSDFEAAGEAGVGVMAVRPWSISLNTQENKAFVKSYLDEYRTPPYVASERGYTAMQVICRTLKAIKGNIENKEGFLKALEKIDAKDTPRGRVRFDQYHHVIQDYYVLRDREMPKDLAATWGKYNREVVDTYKDVDQFWPFAAEQYLAMPKLKTLRGTATE
jgi:branched-chain amino acid transport system substrate-binding protein